MTQTDNARPSPIPRHLQGWEHGLRRLYAEVVDEPMPADFTRLMQRMEQFAHQPN